MNSMQLNEDLGKAKKRFRIQLTPIPVLPTVEPSI